MKLDRLVLKILLAAAVLWASGASVLAAGSDRWTRVESNNFQLVGNADAANLRRAAARLEQFRRVFTELFPDLKFSSPVPTRVVVFKDKQTFDRFKTVEWAAGYFQPGDDVNYIVLAAAEAGEKENYATIFHEYTHFLIDNSLGRAVAPPWLNEGIAEYYERFAIEGDQRVTIGAPHEGNLQVLGNNEFIPFETFFATDYYTLHKQSKESAQLFYAQSWLIVHYFLQSGDGARRAQFDRFVALLMRGANSKDAFQQAFQMDYAAVAAELKAYLAQRRFAASVVPFREKLAFDAEMPAFAVSDAEAKAFQGDLLYHTRRLDEAEKYLGEALALDRNSSLANTALGLVKTRRQQYREAKIFLEKAIANDSKNYLAYYSLALAISRESTTELGFASGFTADDANKIRANLRRAITLNPNFAESYNLYAFVNIVRNEEIDDSIAMIRKALAIAPGNQWYAIRLAELNMRRENFAEARALAQKIVRTASTDNLKVYAENSLRTINSLEAQLLSARNYKKRPDPEDVTDEPLSDEEIARRREKAMMESLNTTLRKTNPDERRLLGTVTNIECRVREVVFSIRTGADVLQLQTDSLERLRLVSYEREFVNTEFGCGALKKDHLAVITFRPDEKNSSKIAGEIVAIEFVPKNFRFLGERE